MFKCIYSRQYITFKSFENKKITTTLELNQTVKFKNKNRFKILQENGKNFNQ